MGQGQGRQGVCLIIPANLHGVGKRGTIFREEKTNRGPKPAGRVPGSGPRPLR